MYVYIYIYILYVYIYVYVCSYGVVCISFPLAVFVSGFVFTMLFCDLLVLINLVERSGMLKKLREACRKHPALVPIQHHGADL